MKKNYVYLFVLISITIVLTLLFASLYNKEVSETSYSYKNLNQITSAEFEEYIIEHPDTIIYISSKNDLDNNKFEKKLINKFKKLNLLENVIYMEKEEIEILEQYLKEKYSYEYNEESLPTIIVINDGSVLEVSIVGENSNVDDIISYEVFQ